MTKYREYLIKPITDFINMYCMYGLVPQQLKKSFAVAIYKKGDPTHTVTGL